MKQKLITLGITAVLTVGSFGVASATPVLVNGDFSQISTPSGARVVTPGTPTQLNYNPNILNGGSYGEFVDGWTTTGPLLSQHVVWFPDATAASTVNAEDYDANLVLFGGPRPLLPGTVTAPPDRGAFLGMQANKPNSGIQQNITGLMPGQTYTVSFDWAATMDNIDTGVESSQFTVSIGGTTYTTPWQTVSSNNGPPICVWIFCSGPTHSTPTFNGWLSESFNFTAGTSSSMLTFLSSGAPSGLPPYALLSNVSIDAVAVPEPSELGMFGIGLLSLGLLTVVGYRRKQQRSGAGRDGGIG